jgi:hypothetical protein
MGTIERSKLYQDVCLTFRGFQDCRQKENRRNPELMGGEASGSAGL